MLPSQYGARVGSRRREKPKIDATSTTSRRISLVGLGIGSSLSAASHAMNTANGPTQASTPVRRGES